MNNNVPEGRSVQRDKNSFIVLGQRDNGISSKSCQGPGRAGTACKNPERDGGQDNHYFSVKIRDRTQDGTRQSLFFPMISYFGTPLEQKLTMQSVTHCIHKKQ